MGVVEANLSEAVTVWDGIEEATKERGPVQLQVFLAAGAELEWMEPLAKGWACNRSRGPQSWRRPNHNGRPAVHECKTTNNSVMQW